MNVINSATSFLRLLTAAPHRQLPWCLGSGCVYAGGHKEPASDGTVRYCTHQKKRGDAVSLLSGRRKMDLPEEGWRGGQIPFCHITRGSKGTYVQCADAWHDSIYIFGRTCMSWTPSSRALQRTCPRFGGILLPQCTEYYINQRFGTSHPSGIVVPIFPHNGTSSRPAGTSRRRGDR